MEDFLYRFLNLYHRLPLTVKRVIGWLYNLLPRRIKYGSFYFSYRDRLHRFNSCRDTGEVEELQAVLLFNQVNSAIDRVPYYQGYPKISSFEELPRYPVINKRIIWEAREQFTASGARRKSIVTNTGGSSGAPLEFLIEKGVTRPKEKAHFDWYWGQFNYRPNSRMMVIRGMPLHQERIYEYNAINNQLFISCHNVNEENIESVLKRINDFRPQFIHAYPSSLKILTSLLEKYHDRLRIEIESIFLGSEQLHKPDRDYFRDFYGASIVFWYGHSERLLHGGNCPHSDEYHFYPSYGYMELLDQEDKPVTEPGREGRIVATGFDNSMMPFIRYDTEDVGTLSERRSCPCGFKGLMLKDIRGRSQDFIRLSDGTRVSVTAFIFGQHIEELRHVREMQLVQDLAGEIEIRVVRDPLFTEEHEAIITDRLVRSVGRKITIRFTYHESIPKTAAGKHLFFIAGPGFESE